MQVRELGMVIERINMSLLTEDSQNAINIRDDIDSEFLLKDYLEDKNVTFKTSNIGVDQEIDIDVHQFPNGLILGVLDLSSCFVPKNFYSNRIYSNRGKESIQNYMFCSRVQKMYQNNENFDHFLHILPRFLTFPMCFR